MQSNSIKSVMTLGRIPHTQWMQCRARYPAQLRFRFEYFSRIQIFFQNVFFKSRIFLKSKFFQIEIFSNPKFFSNRENFFKTRNFFQNEKIFSNEKNFRLKKYLCKQTTFILPEMQTAPKTRRLWWSVVRQRLHQQQRRLIFLLPAIAFIFGTTKQNYSISLDLKK